MKWVVGAVVVTASGFVFVELDHNGICLSGEQWLSTSIWQGVSVFHILTAAGLVVANQAIREAYFELEAPERKPMDFGMDEALSGGRTVQYDVLKI